MRCPECQQRNSVAARKCKFCGAKFQRKEMSRGKKIAIGLFVFFIVGISYLFIAVPKLVDPTEQLIAIAKRVAAGPRSPEDAKEAREAFNKAISNLLQKYGSEPSSDISKRLKAVLPGNAFEVIVADLPRDLKLVEIDTVLQASDFLLMKGSNNETKVIPLPDFEIYDDARIVSDQAGPVLVLLGHTGGQPPHKPMVRTYAILPDSIVDETSSMVPALSGEGHASFAKDGGDVDMEYFLSAMAQANAIKCEPPLAQERNLKLQLKWKEAKYLPAVGALSDSSAAALLLANSLKLPEMEWLANAALGAKAGNLIKEINSPYQSEIVIGKSKDEKKSVGYKLSGPGLKIDLELKKTADSFQLTGYQLSQDKKPAPADTDKSSNGKSLQNASGGNQTTAPIELPATGNQSKPDPAASNTDTQSKPAQIEAAAPDKAKPANNTMPDLLSGLKPERAGRQGENKSDTKQTASQSSAWLDDENSKSANNLTETKTAVATSITQAKEKPQASKSESSSGTAAYISENLGTNSVRMRSGPGLNMRTLTEIAKGSKIQILGESKGWYKVSYAGKTGYVFAPLVSTGSRSERTASSTQAEPSNSSQATGSSGSGNHGQGGGAVVVRGMTLRDDARRPIATVKVGQQVTLLSGLQNNRYKIRTQDGKTGYVYKDALDVKVETPPEFVP